MDKSFMVSPMPEGVCKFNVNIVCTQHDLCDRCGWYEPVSDERKARIRAWIAETEER